MDTSVKPFPDQRLKKFPGAVPFILSISCIERYSANSIVGKIVTKSIKLIAENKNKISLRSDFGLVFKYKAEFRPEYFNCHHAQQ